MGGDVSRFVSLITGAKGIVDLDHSYSKGIINATRLSKATMVSEVTVTM
jgi:hypothetical protein